MFTLLSSLASADNTVKNFDSSKKNKDAIVIGSKVFTEGVLVAEMLATLLEEKYSYKVKRKFNLGGTQFVFNALTAKQIDVYGEYTGTGYSMILNLSGETRAPQIYKTVKSQFLKKFQLVWSQPLGFNNTYAIAIRNNDPQFKNINKVSDLIGKTKNLSLAADHEFMERRDGYNYFSKAYGITFPTSKTSTMDPGLMYSALKNKQVDLIMAYSTDGRIKAYNLKILKDDKNFFPAYQAAYLTSPSVLKRFPKLKLAFKDLENNISEKEIIALNDRVDRLKQEDHVVIKNFLIQKKLLKGDLSKIQHQDIFSYYYSKRYYLLKIFIEHLMLTFASLLIAILLAIPIGIFMTRKKQLAKTIFPVINTLNTIPSLALLGFLIPILGIGYIPAIFALFIYCLLPLIRNTYEGIRGVDLNYIEAATGIGLTKFQILKKVEWPMALPVIIAGIRTAAVIVVGTATLASLVGAGGLGEPIFRGIATVNSKLILLGAVPAAVLAVIIDRFLSLVEKIYVSKGLRPK